MSRALVKEKPVPADINREIEAAIDPWLEHMRWRADFAKWREGRLWQEKRQRPTLDHLRSFLRFAEQPKGNGHARREPADVLSGRLILDLGCGMGGLTTALALEGASVQPLDF